MTGDDLDTIAALLGRPAWQRDAACVEHPELNWVPERRAKVTKQLAICDGCLVRVDCLDFALDHQLLGVWGGVTERDRSTMRHRRPAA